MSDLYNQIIDGIELASTGIKSPVLFISEPGLGKTTTIKIYCEHNNFELITLLASQYSPEDIAGFPVREGNKVIRLNPDWLDKIINHYKKNPNKPLVLFLDEITTASKATQGAILNLIFDRKINDYKFPDNLIILSAGNRSIDLLEESEILISPIKTRFAVINLIPTLKDYLSFIDNSSNNKKLIELFNKIITYLYKEYYNKNISNYNPHKVINNFSGRGIYYFTSYLSNYDKIDIQKLYKYIQYYLGIELENYDDFINNSIINYNHNINLSDDDLFIYKKSNDINEYYKYYSVILEDYSIMYYNKDYFDGGGMSYDIHESRFKDVEKVKVLCNELSIKIRYLNTGVIIKDKYSLDKIINYCKLNNIDLNNGADLFIRDYIKSDKSYIDEITNRWVYLESLNIKGDLK